MQEQLIYSFRLDGQEIYRAAVMGGEGRISDSMIVGIIQDLMDDYDCFANEIEMVELKNEKGEDHMKEITFRKDQDETGAYIVVYRGEEVGTVSKNEDGSRWYAAEFMSGDNVVGGSRRIDAATEMIEEMKKANKKQEAETEKERIECQDCGWIGTTNLIACQSCYNRNPERIIVIEKNERITYQKHKHNPSGIISSYAVMLDGHLVGGVDQKLAYGQILWVATDMKANHYTTGLTREQAVEGMIKSAKGEAVK